MRPGPSAVHDRKHGASAGLCFLEHRRYGTASGFCLPQHCVARMSPHPDGRDQTASIQEQLEQAVRDLWSMLHDSGHDYVVFMDHRRLQTRIERGEDDLYRVSWEPENHSADWIEHGSAFEDPREAVFHGYQGPH